MNNFSFKRGWSQVPLALTAKVKADISHLLSINSNSQWSRKLNGKTTLSPAEIKAVEEIFNKVCITDIWGEELPASSWNSPQK